MESGVAAFFRTIRPQRCSAINDQRRLRLLGGYRPHALSWDCADGDGNVGIEDFLALLGVWGQTGVACDIDGGGVGITDFLALLAAWGPCP